MEKDNVFPFVKRDDMQAYMNSDKAGKEYKVAQLFQHHNLMVDILWNQRKDIDELTRRVECLEKSLKGE